MRTRCTGDLQYHLLPGLVGCPLKPVHVATARASNLCQHSRPHIRPEGRTARKENENDKETKKEEEEEEKMRERRNRETVTWKIEKARERNENTEQRTNEKNSEKVTSGHRLNEKRRTKK